MPTPLSQRHKALDRANYVRMGRTRAKREIELLSREAAWRKVIEHLRSPDAAMRGARVYDVLQWPRRSGKVFVRKLWFELSAPPWTEEITIERLTDRQRNRLIAVLERKLSC